MNYLFSFLFILLNCGAFISAKGPVPVLLWSPELVIPPVPGLKEIGAAHFSQYLNDIVLTKKPTVAVFVEDSLSSEDFVNFGDDDKPVYSELTQKVQQGNVEYMPSVGNPVKAIRLLKDAGYTWKNYAGKIPKINEPTVLVITLTNENAKERHEVLASHDVYISDIYGKLQKAHPNLLAIYTGHKPSWVHKEDNNRVRRAVRDEGEEPEKVETVIRSEDIAIVVSNISYVAKADDTPTSFTTLTATEISNNTDFKYLIATFAEGSLNFTFLANPVAWQWAVASISVTIGTETAVLLSADPVGAPRGWSWFCKEETVFYSEGKTTKWPRLTIKDVQMQANIDMTTFEFGQPIDCVPYFSMAIWSGILVITMLLAIMLWGILMLMDINTNDRFDDPKGKTITISATD